MTNLDKVRHQRQLCSDIVAGFLHYGMELSDAEHTFVLKCSSAMKPINTFALSALQKINDRRWGR